MNEFWADPAFWVVLSTGLPFLLFTLVYLLGSPGWWKGRAGRALLILGGSIVLVLLRSTINIATPIDYPGREPIGYILLAGVQAAGWYLFYTLIREQQAGRRHVRANPQLVDRRCGDDRRQNRQ